MSRRPEQPETTGAPPEGTPTRLDSEHGVATRLEPQGIATRIEDQGAPAATLPPWPVGEVVADLYEIRQVYESGGMGLVFRAFHRGWSTEVAIKRPREELVRTALQRDNLVREAETWVNLGIHPHIVCCYYVRTIDGAPCMFVELVDGGSLKSWIADRRLGTLEQMLDVAIQVAWGLHHAHEHGLVHQDVKPDNVLVTPDGTAKVTDFGLARARAADVEPRPEPSASHGTVVVRGCGMTPAYCSPEQAQGEALSRRTDTWSWGLTVLEAFAGSPFWVTAPDATVGQLAPQALEHLVTEGPFEPDLPPLPGGLAELLRDCFRNDPDERPRTMMDVADRVRAIYETETGTEYPRTLQEAAELRADALNNKALSLFDLGRHEEASAAWDEALRLDSQHPEATLNKALIEWRQGAIADDEVVRRLRAIRVTDPRAGLFLGAVHLERAAPDEAELELKQLLALPSFAQEGQAWRLLGDAQLAQQKFDEAGRAYEQAHLLLPDDRQLAGRQDLARLGSPCPELASTRVAPASLNGEDIEGIGACAGDRLLAIVNRSHKGCAEIWDVLGNRRLQTLEPCFGIEASTFSAAGDMVAIGTAEHLEAWDLGSGRCLSKMDVHIDMRWHAGQGESIEAIALTPDGRLAVTGSRDNTLSLWNLRQPRETRLRHTLDRLFGHTGRVRAVAVTADGTRIVSASADRTLRLWELEGKKELRVLVGHEDEVCSVALTPDGTGVVSGSKDHSVKVWQLETGACVATLRGHRGAVTAVAVDPTGQLLLSGGDDSTIRVWDAETGACLRTFEIDSHGQDVRSLAVSANGDRILVWVGLDQLLLIELQHLRCRAHAPTQICRSRSHGEMMASQKDFLDGLHAAREAWQAGRAGEACLQLDKARTCAGFERDPEALQLNQEMAASLPRATLRDAWLVRSLEGHEHPVHAVAITPDGSQIVSGDGPDMGLWSSDSYTVRTWRLPEGRSGPLFEPQEGKLNSLLVTPNGRTVIAGDSRGVLEWNLDTGRFLGAFHHCGHEVTSVAITPDGQLVLGTSSDHSARLWDERSGRYLRALNGHQWTVLSSAVSPDGRFAATGGGDREIRLWDLRSGSWPLIRRIPRLPLRVLQGHGQDVNAVAFTLDGRLLLSASGNYIRTNEKSIDNTLRIWDPASGQCLRVLEGHEQAVMGVASTHDGRFAVTASKDTTLRVWDLATGACLKTLEGHTRGVNAVAITADDRYVVSASDDTSVRLWELDWEVMPEGRPEPLDRTYEIESRPGLAENRNLWSTSRSVLGHLFLPRWYAGLAGGMLRSVRRKLRG